MKKITFIALLILSFMIFIRAPARGESENNDYNLLYIYSRGDLFQNFKNLRGDAVDVPIMSFQFQYYAYGKNIPKHLSLNSLGFLLSEVNGLALTDWRNIRLVVDENSNSRFDAGEKVIDVRGVLKPDESTVQVKDGVVTFNQGKIIFKNLDIKINDDHDCCLILLADFSNLKYGDEFFVSLLGEEDNVGFSESKPIICGSISNHHQVGNKPPKLSFVADKPFNSETAVMSNYNNLSGTEFVFRVIYSDANNDKPVDKFLEIFNAEGIKRYKMSRFYNYSDFRDAADSQYRWVGGITFETKIKLRFTGQPVKYRFIFSDGEKRAVGKAAAEQTVPVMPWIFISSKATELKPDKALPGQRIEIKTWVLKHLSVKIDWRFALNENFSDFTVKNIFPGKAELYSGNKMYELVPLRILISPKKTNNKPHIINSIVFPYRVNVRIKDKIFSLEEKIKLPPVKFTIVPAILADCKIFPDKASLGEIVNYRLTFLLYQGAEIKSNMSSLTFNPFLKLTNRPTIKHSQYGQIITETYSFKTLIYDLPANDEQCYTFPGFTVEVVWEKKNFVIAIPAKKIKFFPPLSHQELKQPINLNIAELLPDTLKKPYLTPSVFMLTGGGLICVSIGMLLLLFVYRGREQKTERKRKTRLFLQAQQQLITLLLLIADKDKEISYQKQLHLQLERLLAAGKGESVDRKQLHLQLERLLAAGKGESVDRKQLHLQLERLLAAGQTFLGYLCPPSEKNIRAQTPQNLIRLIKNDHFALSGLQEKKIWTELLTSLNHLIYGDFSTDRLAKLRNQSKKLADFLSRATGWEY